MNFAVLSDLPTVVIVVGGTLLGTFLRCGPGECAAALRGLVGCLGVAGFDSAGLRARLAVQLREIARDGLLRARPHSLGDREFTEAIAALLAQRSLAGAQAVHDHYRVRRHRLGDAAIRTLAQGAELAPVFGLAGTLISLGKLPANGIDRAAYMGAIGMAVQATLYGLVLANLVLAPLARLIERREQREDKARQVLIDWLLRELAPICERGHPPGPAHPPAYPAAARPHPLHADLA